MYSLSNFHIRNTLLLTILPGLYNTALDLPPHVGLKSVSFHTVLSIVTTLYPPMSFPPLRSCIIGEIVGHWSFYSWLISLSAMSSRVIYIITDGRVSAFNYILLWMIAAFSLAIHPLVGQMRILALLNSVCSQHGNADASEDVCDLSSLGCIPSSRIAGSHGLFLVTWETAILPSPWLHIDIPLSRFRGSFPATSPPALVIF